MGIKASEGVMLAEVERLEGEELEAARAVYHAYLVNGQDHALLAQGLLSKGFTPKGIRHLSDTTWKKRGK